MPEQSASSGSSDSGGLPGGNRGNNAPFIAPVFPAAGAGGAATDSGAFPAHVPPAPSGRGEQGNAENENGEDHDLPEHCIHWVVQPDYTVESLAAASGTSAEVILRINRTTSIRPRQVIRLPAAFLIPCCD